MQQITASIKDRDIFSQTVNLSDLFRPDTFLNALRQHTARITKKPMDALILSTSWSGEIKHGKNHSIKITGLQLEGCIFEGGRLSESAQDSPSVNAVPPCQISWISQVMYFNRLILIFSIMEMIIFLFLRNLHNKKHVKQFHYQSILVQIERKL